MELNYWDEFEYSKLRLLLHENKVNSILGVLRREKEYDDLFPISVEMHLTNRCNLNCEWCTDAGLRGRGEILNKEVVFSLIDEFSIHGTGVTLEGGGEPTMHPQFQDIVDYAIDKSVGLGLISNGVKDITDSISSFKWVRISLDASCREEYIKEKGIDRFDQVMNNISKYCIKRNPQKTFIGVGYVITNRNINHIEELVNELEKFGVDYIYLRPVEEANGLMPDISNMLHLQERMIEITKKMRMKYIINIRDRIVENNNSRPCVAHSLTSIIHADGCVNLCEKRRHDEIALGNVYEMSFDKIWNSSIRRNATSKLLDADKQMGCRVCRITGFNDVFYQLAHVNCFEFI